MDALPLAAAAVPAEEEADRPAGKTATDLRRSPPAPLGRGTAGRGADALLALLPCALLSVLAKCFVLRSDPAKRRALLAEAALPGLAPGVLAERMGGVATRDGDGMMTPFGARTEEGLAAAINETVLPPPTEERPAPPVPTMMDPSSLEVSSLPSLIDGWWWWCCCWTSLRALLMSRVC